MNFTEILSQFNSSTQSIASSLRDFLLDKLKDIKEIPDNAANLVGYGYGTGYKNMICTILLSKKGVKLGFYKGSELPDPDQLLTGTGKVHRYVEIRSEHEIRTPALKKLLEEALIAYQKRRK